ncbi:MAG TPA: VWA domain-containing protein [Thermoanaerobaculia bacterium]|nr:VWA domain-containing protein [Thermoanaerobaculia bacterium]
MAIAFACGVGLVADAAAGGAAGPAGEVELPAAELPASFADRWLSEHSDLMGAAERARYAELQMDRERLLFDALFWRSRDPDPTTRVNEAARRWAVRRALAIHLGLPLGDARRRAVLLHGEPDTVLQLGGCSPIPPDETGARVVGLDREQRCDLGFDILHYRTRVEPPWVESSTGDPLAPDGATPALTWVVHGTDGDCRALPRSEGTRDWWREVSTKVQSPACRAVAHDLVERLGDTLRDWRPESASPARRALPAGSWLAELDRQIVGLESGEVTARWQRLAALTGRRRHPSNLLGVWVPDERSLGRLSLELPAWASSGQGAWIEVEVSFVVEDRAGGAALADGRGLRVATGALAPPRGAGPEIALLLEAPPDAEALAIRVSDGHRTAIEIFRLEHQELGRSARKRPPAPPDDTRLDSGVRVLPPRADLLSGRVELGLATWGAVESVEVLLDGQSVARTARASRRLSVDLGRLARRRELTAIARSADGRMVGADRLAVNGGSGRFGVSILEIAGVPARDAVRPRLDVEVPAGAFLDRVELLVGDRVVAVFDGAETIPSLELMLPDAGAAPRFLLARAHLVDGRSAEAVRLLDAFAPIEEELDVDLVEVYFSARGPGGDPPSPALSVEEVSVLEDDESQQVLTVRPGGELPLTVALMVDTSRSVARRFPLIREGGRRFLEQALRTGDRAAVIAFSRRTVLLTPFTGETDRLGAGLARLQIDRGTALFDAVARTALYLAEQPGRKAILVLSDGEELHSALSRADATAVAQGLGVAVYTVRVEDPTRIAGSPRRDRNVLGRQVEAVAAQVLSRLATATGGRWFVAGTDAELSDAYRLVLDDLRSQYLVTYQTTRRGPGFRKIEVETSRRGVGLRHAPGYQP